MEVKLAGCVKSPRAVTWTSVSTATTTRDLKRKKTLIAKMFSRSDEVISTLGFILFLSASLSFLPILLDRKKAKYNKNPVLSTVHLSMQQLFPETSMRCGISGLSACWLIGGERRGEADCDLKGMEFLCPPESPKLLFTYSFTMLMKAWRKMIKI